MVSVTGPTWEDVVLRPAFTTGEPTDQTLSGLLGHLELHRLLGFLLNDRCPVPRGTYHELADAQLHEIAPTQLAVDCEVKEGEVSDPVLSLQIEADRQHLLWLERRLRSNERALVPGHSGSSVAIGLSDSVRSTTFLLGRMMAAEDKWS